MKVMFVSNVSWSLFNFRRGLMMEVKKRGHEVVFCAMRDDYTSRLEQMGFRYIPISLDRKGTNVFKDLILFFSLLRIYTKERPDWIYHNSIKPNIYGSIAAFFSRCRCINTISGLGYLFIRKTFLLGIIKLFYKMAGFCSKKTFFQNKDDLKFFVDQRLIHSEKCQLVAGSGVDVDFFKRKEKQDPALAKECFVFLYLGRILWDKGIGELIAAIRILREKYPFVKIDFLGMIDEGNPASNSRIQVQEWQTEGIIGYLGDTDDVRPYLENCDCVVLPSYREGTPRSLLEAAAMELPVIATDVPGCRDVVEEGKTGFLVQAKNVSDLFKAMEKMVKMPIAQRIEMGKKGRSKIIKEYNEKLVIDAYCSQAGL